MKNLKIVFDICEEPLHLLSLKGVRKSFEAKVTDGILSVFVQYDPEERPLELSSRVALYDKVEVIMLDYRIELHINGKLKDEEWPYGARLFALGDQMDIGSAQVFEYTKKNECEPSIISSFENAEGWRPGADVFVGDCMPYCRGGEYHVLYLKDRRHHRSKWGLGAHQWEHISTKDFKEWSVHPTAVPISDQEEGSICTGSWIQNGEREYLYYTVRRVGGRPAPIRRSVSSDGYHFEKDSEFGFAISEKYKTESARDPKVILGADGLFHMFLTTALRAENLGCLAHYVSSDMEKWDEREPIYIADSASSPECPDYFKFCGKYYLVFSHGGVGHYMVSDQPFCGFSMPDDPRIPCYGVPKCAEWQGRLIFAGFKKIEGYAGTMTFKAATAKENGELVFFDL